MDTVNIAQSMDSMQGFGMRPLARLSREQQADIRRMVANSKQLDALDLYYQNVVTDDGGLVKLLHPRTGLQVNSILRKDEWEELDRAVVQAAAYRMNAIQRLQDLGLVQRLGGPGTLISQWNVVSEMTEASVSVEGVTKADMDQVDHLLKGVTIPVIHKRFDISTRTLDASRRLGDSLDTTNAAAATRVVSEKLEEMFFVGETTVNLNGNPIYGVTTEANVNTGSATGDFGTLSNIYPTFIAMIQAAAADHFHGPFEVWVYSTQYNEMLNVYTDGSGENALDRVLRIPQITAIHPTDWLSAGQLVMVQMTRDVVDLAMTQMPTLVEWMSPDGMLAHFKVVSIAAPRVKSDYATHSGIVYYTGA